MTWYDEYASTCSECLSMYADRIPPGVAPCDTCRVDLTEENIEPADVYLMTRGQVITAGPDNRPIDISTQAVKTTMDLLGIEDQLGCLKKVRRLWYGVNNAS